MSAPYTLPALPYAFDALEPHIDEATMKVHHGGHHQAYTDKLNAGLETLRTSQPDGAALAALPIEQLLGQLDKVTDPKLRTLLRNNGGGYVNHCWFWRWMAPPSASAPAAPSAAVLAAIEKDFGSLDAFKEQFSNAAATVFGSGWAWLVWNTEKGKLEVLASPNQDSPLMSSPHLKPILGLDVWEHAYYLKYQNKRLAYIAAWWQVVNWTRVEEMMTEASK